MAKIILSQETSGSCWPHVFEQLPVRVGRSLDNDLILTDPYVCGHHLQFSEDEQGVWLQDLSSINGCYLNAKPLKGRALLSSGDEIRIGKTELIYQDHQQILAPTLPLQPRHNWRPIWLTWLIVGVFLGVEAIQLWLTQSSGLKTASFLLQIIQNNLPALLLWSVIWALLSKLLRGQALFHQHLGLITLVFLLYDGIKIALVIPNYQWPELSLSNYGEQLASLVLFALLSYRSLAYASRLKPAKRKWLTGILSSLILGYLVLSQIADEDEEQIQLSYPSQLLPPQFKWRHSGNLDQFLNQYQQKLDSAQQQPSATD